MFGIKVTHWESTTFHFPQKWSQQKEMLLKYSSQGAYVAPTSSVSTSNTLGLLQKRNEVDSQQHDPRPNVTKIGKSAQS